MKSLVVFEPQRTMMWCQPRRISECRQRRAGDLLGLFLGHARR